jgi:hypothetical protein
MCQGGVGDQPLPIPLDCGDDPTIENADDAKGEEERGEAHHRVREELKVEADDPVGAELRHHPAE